MEEAEKQRRMITKSSIKRKPFADLTNIAPKPSGTSSFSQSKRPGSATASNSSVGTTQNRIHVHHPVTVPLPSITPDHLVGDENHVAYARRQSIPKTRSNVKAAVPSYQTSVEGTRRNGKEGSVPLGSSMLEKIKDQGKGNQSYLVKTRNDGKEKPVGLHCPSMEKMKNKRKAIDAPASDSMDTHSTEEKENGVPSSNSSTGNTNVDVSIIIPPLMKRKDKGKEISVPLNYPPMKNLKHNMVQLHSPLSGVKIKDSMDAYSTEEKENGDQSCNSSMGNSNVDMSTIMPLMKRKDKGKAISVPLNNPPMKNLKHNMVELHLPLSGVKIKDKGETVSASSRVDLAQKDEGKSVATPTSCHTLQKKDIGSSCPPLLRITSNRNAADEAEDIFESKPQTDPPPDRKKRRCLAKKDVNEYALPQEFIEQQRAYFKEIDDFELEVEEV